MNDLVKIYENAHFSLHADADETLYDSSLRNMFHKTNATRFVLILHK